MTQTNGLRADTNLKAINTLRIAVGTLALSALMLGALAPGALAQDALPARTSLLPTTNTKEINLAGSIFLDGSKPYALAGSYGQFLSPSLEAGLTGSVAGADGTKTITTAGAFADYYFRGDANSPNPSALVPYIGVFAGYSHKDSGSGSLGGQAGVKYFFNPNVAADVEYQYRSTEHGNGTNQILLGLSTFFR